MASTQTSGVHSGPIRSMRDRGAGVAAMHDPRARTAAVPGCGTWILDGGGAGRGRLRVVG